MEVLLEPGMRVELNPDERRKPGVEDKQKICDLLCAALQATRKNEDMVSLHYELDLQGEWVTAVYKNSCFRRINVTCDSGMAMIRDIINRV
ncbi:MAG: hypothetical protein LUE87_06345 [Lachnospiraceae bacterium]|nr:hypothetical protein [Lachnospiraceae bacterium]